MPCTVQCLSFTTALRGGKQNIVFVLEAEHRGDSVIVKRTWAELQVVARTVAVPKAKATVPLPRFPSAHRLMWSSAPHLLPPEYLESKRAASSAQRALSQG